MRLDEPALWHGTVRNAGGPGVDCYGRVRETEDGIIVEVVRGVGDGRLEWVREPDGSKLMVPIFARAMTAVLNTVRIRHVEPRRRSAARLGRGRPEQQLQQPAVRRSPPSRCSPRSEGVAPS